MVVSWCGTTASSAVAVRGLRAGYGGAPAPATQPTASANTGSAQVAPAQNATLSPAVQRVVGENNLDPKSIQASGPKGNITKADALAAIAEAVKNAGYELGTDVTLAALRCGNRARPGPSLSSSSAGRDDPARVRRPPAPSLR